MRLLLGVEERDYECSADSPQNISAVCNMLRAHDIATETRDLLQSVLYDNNLVTNVTEQKLWIESEWNDIPSSSIVLPVLQLSSSYSGCNIPPFNASETAASIHC